MCAGEQAFAQTSLDRASPISYLDLLRRFVVRKIVRVVYGDDPGQLEDDKDVKLMLSDILVIFGYPGEISSEPLVSSVMPLVFDSDSRISDHAERIICEVEARDSAVVGDPSMSRIFAFCHWDMLRKNGEAPASRERPHPGWGPGTPHITQPPDGAETPLNIELDLRDASIFEELVLHNRDAIARTVAEVCEGMREEVRYNFDKTAEEEGVYVTLSELLKFGRISLANRRKSDDCPCQLPSG